MYRYAIVPSGKTMYWIVFGISLCCVHVMPTIGSDLESYIV